MSLAAGSLARFDRDRSGGGRRLLAGVDEAGRGCWAGPVVAAAVILPSCWGPAHLDDSKRLSATRRESLLAEIQANALCWGACAVSALTIDEENILQATLQAMSRAVRKLRPAPEVVLVDGRQVPPDLPCPAEAIVRGDGRSAAIAAASILAKVLRDRVMRAWDRFFPGYDFASNKGYGSPRHRSALGELGPCPLHRLTYRPVATCGQGRLWNESR